MNHLRAAVIGVGYLGSYHAEKYFCLPGVELTAVVDNNEESAQQVAKRYGVAAYTDYQAVLEQVDVVSITVPTQHHYAIARDFLEAGVHVLLEKPITHCVDNADTLIKLADANNLVLQVGHIERFNPAVQLMQDKVLEPTYIETHRLAPFTTRGADVDVVLDLMIHDIDIVLNLVDSPIGKIQSTGASIVTDHIDIANAQLEFENGCVANITASRISPDRLRKIKVIEHNAYCSVDYAARKAHYIRKQTAYSGGPHIPLTAKVEEYSFDDSDLLLDEIRAFIESVATGTSPVVPGEHGKRALGVALNISSQIKSLKSYKRSRMAPVNLVYG